MSYIFLHPITDCSLSTKSGYAEAWLNSLFYHVQDSRQRLCDLVLDFIGDHLLRCGGDQIIIIFQELFQVLLLSLQLGDGCDSRFLLPAFSIASQALVDLYSLFPFVGSSLPLDD